MTKVLLTSVFKPFGIDDMYSRKGSIVEIFHNQLTVHQGIFSIRGYYNSYGINVIGANIDTPTTVLDFPTLDRFRRELKKGYDIVGISSLAVNIQKVKRMAEEVRRISPKSKIVLGGFCAAAENIERIVDVDYVCIGEGISFMRDLLGKAEEFKFRHPTVLSEAIRILGVPMFFNNKHPYIIAGLGCSYGCGFCTPSHFFGKKHIEYLKSGKEIFEVAQHLSKISHSNTFTVIGDDNFLLSEERAMELREQMLKHDAPYNYFIFASADKLINYDPVVLAEMGINAVWIGRETKFVHYGKNYQLDLKLMVANLRKHGIKTTMSSMLMVDQHTKENIFEDIDDHIDTKPVFSQFAQFSPAPGTPLYDRIKEEGRFPVGLVSKTFTQ